MKEPCCYCNEPVDRDALRPYGPGGGLTCLPCAMLPDNIVQTDRAFNAQYDLATSISSTIVIGGNNGPEPYIREGE